MTITISGTYSTGIAINYVGFSPVTFTGVIKLSGSGALAVAFYGNGKATSGGTAYYNWSLTNEGKIEAGYYGANGVRFGSGSKPIASALLVNSGDIYGGHYAAAVHIYTGGKVQITNNLHGRIVGSPDGIVTQGIETLVNYGYISSSKNFGNDGGTGVVLNHSGATIYGNKAVYFVGSGMVTNYAGALINGSRDNVGYGTNDLGIQMTTGTITNAGSVYGGDVGILIHSGTIHNESGGIIVGGVNGISVTSSGIITNDYGGTIDATYSGTPSIRPGGVGVVAGTNATIVNGGLLEGFYRAISIPGGVVTNLSTGIVGANGFARNAPNAIVFSGTSASTLDDYGTIDGSVVFGVSSASNLMIYHPGAAFSYVPAATNHSFVINGGHGELELASASNPGTLAGLGKTFTNFASIQVDYGAYWLLTNTNTFATGQTVRNEGTIAGIVALHSAGEFINNPGATISGVGGGNGPVQATSGSAQVLNSGTIEGTGDAFGIYMGAGGSVINASSGVITGYGVRISGGAGTLANYGLISGSGGFAADGVIVVGSGSITNAASAVITGQGDGIDLAGAGTVTDAGTLVGGDGIAVELGGVGSNLLALAPGYTISGNAVANASTIANNTLELMSGATPGMIAGVGSKFQNFGSIRVDTGANWVVAGNNTIGSGTAANVLGSLTVVGTLINAGTITGMTGVAVGLYGGGTIIDFGTINGGDANAIVFSGAGSNLLELAPGYAISGNVLGSDTNGAVNRLELSSGAAQRTLTGLGTKFQGFNEITLNAGASWALTSSGSFTGGITLEPGATLATSGTLTTTAGSKIVGVNGATTLANSGTIISTDPEANGVALYAGGSVTNAASALIQGFNGIGVASTAGTISNAGTILGIRLGIGLGAGGSIGNTGQITGAIGAYIGGSIGTLTNSGTITGLVHAGAELYGGGILIDSGTITGGHGTAVVFGGISTNLLDLAPSYSLGGDAIGSGSAASNAIELASGSAAGTLSQLGSKLLNFSTISVDAGAQWTLSNSDTLAGAVTLAGAYLLNAGTINASDAALRGSGGASTIVNIGRLIGSTGNGIALYSGGAIINTASAFIQGFNGIGFANAAGTVSNAGTILGTRQGIGLGAGGSIGNVGQIAGAVGIYLSGGVGTVTNSGTIRGTLHAGVELYGGGTIINSGLISGHAGTAVAFGGDGSNRMILYPGASFSGSVLASPSAANTLELASGASTGTLSGLGTQFNGFGAISFDTGADWFIAGNTAGLAGTISGFTLGDAIEITGITATGSSFVGSILTLTEASGAATLDLSGSFTTSDFAVTNVSGGAEVSIACFRAGTRIRTVCGDVPVERLRVGDQAEVLFGGMPASITWIGHRALDCRRHPRPQQVWPVRVSAGAFGTDLPCRDLFLSPDHAVFVGKVLIPVKCLINGRNITQVPSDEVTYYHVELSRHDVLLAEGLPTESYLDTGVRANFSNGGASVRLHPDFSAHMWEAVACAPLVVVGLELDAARDLVNSKCASIATVSSPKGRGSMHWSRLPPRHGSSRP